MTEGLHGVDLASAFKRGVAEEDERPPFSRQASANEGPLNADYVPDTRLNVFSAGPSVGENDQTNRDGETSLALSCPQLY